MKKPAKNPSSKKAAISGRGPETAPSPAFGARGPKIGLLKRPKAIFAAGQNPAKRSGTGRVLNRAANPGRAGSVSLTKRLEAWNRYRESYNPLRGLTLARAVSLLEDFKRGAMADLQWVYFHIEQADADLFALIELGLSRLAEMDWDIVASEEADPKLADAQVTYLREQFDKIDNIEEAIEHFALARFRGFAHAEKIYDAAGDLVHLEIVDQWNAVRDGLKGPWRYNPEARSTTFAGLPAENDMPPERFVFRQVRRHVNWIALLKFVRANLSDKDWDAFIEIYGIPSGVVIGPPNVPQGRETEYEEGAAAIAEGGSGYLPNGSTYVQNKAEAGSTPFKARLDHLSEKLVLVGTGGKLTMLTDATGLGSGASEAHSKVFDSIASAEAGRISRIITEQIVQEMLAQRFPGQKCVAYFRLAANEETDTSAMVQDVKTLHDAGFDLDEAEVSERTGWKVTKRAEPAGGAGFGFQIANRIRNRAEKALPDQAEEFRKATLAELAAADRKDQEALLSRLAEIDRIQDEAAWMAAMAKLDADFPSLLDEIIPAPAKAALYHRVNATALVDGAIEAAAKRGTPAPRS